MHGSPKSDPKDSSISYNNPFIVLIFFSVSSPFVTPFFQVGYFLAEYCATAALDYWGRNTALEHAAPGLNEFETAIRGDDGFLWHLLGLKDPAKLLTDKSVLGCASPNVLLLASNVSRNKGSASASLP